MTNTNKIKLGIVGFGNLSRAIIANIGHFNDMEIVAVFSRRPSAVTCNYLVEHVDDIFKHKGKIDIMMMCGGSKDDLPVQSPKIAECFCLIDSFDTHANIPEHVNKVGEVAQKAKTLATVAIGWDPGLFSLMRVYFDAVLPNGSEYTFWGEGVSQGHSDAIRRVDGVANGVQYTIPKTEALNKVRTGSNPILTTREKHFRKCFVVAKEGADKTAIIETIKNMPNYFSDYDTEVNFISQEEFDKNHKKIPHGGNVIRSGSTGANGKTKQVAEFSLKLESNPEFTSSVMLAYARATHRLWKEGKTGCMTIMDVAPKYLTALSEKDLFDKI
ncbi:MAG: diaminopimelate dehydrogenase [Firmicutes bacterium]|nr:diaminopimelate dehydrogenase [Bacillota bacterium]MCL2256578.1 diaminopimelate dehydrogenase [Bacillota bacterium]